MITALVAGVFGLAGTIVGSVLALWSAARREDRTWRRQREHSIRNELRAAISEYCTATIAFLNAELGRRATVDDDPAAVDVADRARRARATASVARYQLELASDDRQLRATAQQAFTLVNTLRRAADDAVQTRITELHELVADLVARGRHLLTLE